MKASGRGVGVAQTGEMVDSNGFCNNLSLFRLCLSLSANCTAGLRLREAKPGGFPNRGVPHFLRERSGLCRGPFRDCSSQVLLIGRERGSTNRENPEKIGKVPKKSEKSRKNRRTKNDKKDQKDQKGPKKDKNVQEGQKRTKKDRSGP